MTSKRAKQWVVRVLLAAGVILALVAAAPEAEAGFRLSVGTGGFYFAVGHHDYYPYYQQSAHYGGYGATSFSFHNTLGDYGYWQYVPEMGMQVWIPYVEYGWRPYTYGHWTYTSYGWTWVSYEPWGWIPHHYGNWTYMDHYGWTWVPGYTWRPHCVNFALVNGYIGWAPVAPPWHRYHCYRGYRYHGDRGWYSGWRHGHRHHDYSGIDYSAYVFVDNRNFYGTGIQDHVLLPGSGADLFRAGQVMPLGETLDLDYVRGVTGRSISPVSLDRQVYQVNGSEMVHYQPRGQEELVRQAALPTVNKALAPGFQKHGVDFKGTSARSAGAVNGLFKQGGVAPKTTLFTRASVSSGMANDPYYQKQKRMLDNLAQTRSSKTDSAFTGRTERASNRSAGSTAAVASGRSGGYKPRTGAVSGKSGAVHSGRSSSSKSRAVNQPPVTGSRSVNRGQSASGKSGAVNNGSSSSRGHNRSVSKPPATGSRSVNRGKPPASTRTPSRPPQGKNAKPAGSSSARSTASRGKPPASTRTPSRPPQGKPAKPAGTSSARSGASRGKPPGKASGKPAGAPAGKSSGKSSSGTRSGAKGHSGKRG